MISNVISIIKKISIFDNFYFKNLANKLIKDKIKFIDIGAAGDLIPRWKKIENKIYTIAFEPDKEAFRKLKKKRKDSKKIFNIALSDKKGNKKFYVCKDEEKSSFYKPNYEFLKSYPDHERYNIKKTIKFGVNKLDNIGNFNPDFIKIDTQGSELEILKGSKKNLKNCLGLEIEVEFKEIYKGQKLFDEVFKFLNKNGFDFVDFSEKTYWSFNNSSKIGQNLIFANALFLKKNIFSRNILKKRVNKYLLILLLYNKVNLVENILNQMNDAQKKNLKNIIFIFFVRSKFISAIKKMFNFLIKFLGVELSNNNIN